jgi:hypothetical protein
MPEQPISSTETTEGAHTPPTSSNMLTGVRSEILKQIAEDLQDRSDAVSMGYSKSTNHDRYSKM